MLKLEELKLIPAEKTDMEFTREEILKHFPKMKDPNDPGYKIVKEIHDQTNGNIPQSLKLFAERIKDPLDLVVIGYLIGQGVTETAILNALDEELPVIMRDCMREGAKLAMQHMSRDPEQKPGNPFPITDPSKDPAFQ